MECLSYTLLYQEVLFIIDNGSYKNYTPCSCKIDIRSYEFAKYKLEKLYEYFETMHFCFHLVVNHQFLASLLFMRKLICTYTQRQRFVLNTTSKFNTTRVLYHNTKIISNKLMTNMTQKPIICTTNPHNRTQSVLSYPHRQIW